MLHTKDGQLLNVTLLSYTELIDAVKLTQPELASLISTMNPTEDRFYKASYRFAQPILARHNCYLPLANGQSIEINSPQLPAELADDLQYDPLVEDPLILMLNKTSEFYVNQTNRVLSQNILKPSDMIGVTRATDKNNSTTPTSATIRNLNAGSRSLFMLNKISDQAQYNKLQKRYKLRKEAPDTIEQQWKIFAELAENANLAWRCEAIYFPRSWIKKLKPFAYAAISLCLLDIHRKSYNVLHNIGQIWESQLSEIYRRRELDKYSSYAANTAKHLLMIAAGSIIAHSPAINDDSAPISDIKTIYNDVYYGGQHKHSVIIFEPTLFNITNGIPVYYSLNYPTVWHLKWEYNNNKSNIALLEEIRFILYDIYINEILRNPSQIDASLYNLAQKVEYSFYHSDPKTHDVIKSSELLATEDLRFNNNDGSTLNKNAPILRGFIKIARKDT